MNDRLVGRREAGRLLGISPSTVKRLAERGTLKEIRLTRTSHPRYLLSHLAELGSPEAERLIPEKPTLVDLGLQCAYAGCEKPRRRVQAAKYCEDHATVINGVRPDNEWWREVRRPKRTCLRCGKEYDRRTGLRSPAMHAWDAFCVGCRSLSPLKADQLRHHHVSYEQAVEWLMRGEKLPCTACGSLLYRRGSRSPQIDHDRRCCSGPVSCGECVRGVTHGTCNSRIGAAEALVETMGVDRFLAYIGAAP